MNKKALKVLIVEDNLVNQKVTSFPFIKQGLKPDIAENGKIAYEVYSDKHHDLILMDIQMPIMDGVESTKRIRQYEKENNLNPTVIIAVTANILLEERDEYLSYGLNDIVTKPLNFTELQKVINKHIK